MPLIWGLILGGGGKGGGSLNLAGASVSTSVIVATPSSSPTPLRQLWYEGERIVQATPTSAESTIRLPVVYSLTQFRYPVSRWWLLSGSGDAGTTALHPALQFSAYFRHKSDRGTGYPLPLPSPAAHVQTHPQHRVVGDGDKHRTGNCLMLDFRRRLWIWEECR